MGRRWRLRRGGRRRRKGGRVGGGELNEATVVGGWKRGVGTCNAVFDRIEIDCRIPRAGIRMDCRNGRYVTTMPPPLLRTVPRKSMPLHSMSADAFASKQEHR